MNAPGAETLLAWSVRLFVACYFLVMRISDAISPSTRLAIPFAGDAVLNIEYRNSSVTLAQMEKMLADAEEAMEATKEEEESKDSGDRAQIARMRERVASARKNLIGQIVGTVVSWDLTQDDNETVIPLTEEALVHVPTNVFTAIIKAVRRDQQADGEGK
jgi:leucyl aminopeptidase (aminopeptidase T)